MNTCKQLRINFALFGSSLIADHPAEWFLNLKFSRNRRDGVMKIDQSAYAEQKLREFGLEHDTAPLIPMAPSSKLTTAMTPGDSESTKSMDQIP